MHRCTPYISSVSCASPFNKVDALVAVCVMCDYVYEGECGELNGYNLVACSR